MRPSPSASDRPEQQGAGSTIHHVTGAPRTASFYSSPPRDPALAKQLGRVAANDLEGSRNCGWVDRVGGRQRKLDARRLLVGFGHGLRVTPSAVVSCGNNAPVSASMYGRPFRRRKAALFVPGILCWLCHQPIRWYGEFTLDHVDGQAAGRWEPVRPAHRRCNLQRAARKANETKRRRYGSAAGGQ
jgi:hypothetical protein